MAKWGLIVVGALLTALVLELCYAEDNHWPNFSCHRYNISGDQERSFNYNRMGWRSCLESYKKYKGNCAQLCVLAADKILARKVPGNPIIFDVDAFITFFAEELGYTINGTAGPEQDLMTNVRGGMETCKKNRELLPLKYVDPEYATMKSLRKSPCEPWKNFLQCFHSVIGCGVLVLDK